VSPGARPLPAPVPREDSASGEHVEGSWPGRSAIPAFFPDDVTPINIFPRLLNPYAGTNIPIAAKNYSWTTCRRWAAPAA
jgi:hypothetical protein